AATLAVECGMQVLRARGRSRERELPYGVVMQLLESDLRQGRNGVSATSAVDDIRGAYRMSLGAARDAPLALLVDDADYADEPSVEALLYLSERIGDAPIAVILTAGTEALKGPSPLGDFARRRLTTRCRLDPLSLEGTERR